MTGPPNFRRNEFRLCSNHVFCFSSGTASALSCTLNCIKDDVYSRSGTVSQFLLVYAMHSNFMWCRGGDLGNTLLSCSHLIKNSVLYLRGNCLPLLWRSGGTRGLHSLAPSPDCAMHVNLEHTFGFGSFNDLMTHECQSIWVSRHHSSNESVTLIHPRPWPGDVSWMWNRTQIDFCANEWRSMPYAQVAHFPKIGGKPSKKLPNIS